MENERVEDVNERLRKAAESENWRDMVDRVCNPAVVSDKQLWHDRKPKETGEGRLIDGESGGFQIWERIWAGSPPER